MDKRAAWTPDQRAEFIAACEKLTYKQLKELHEFGTRLFNAECTVELMARALAAGQIDRNEYVLAKRLALIEDAMTMREAS